MLGKPGFLVVKHGNGVLYELVHALVGSALNVLLDQFLQLRPQMNLHYHILPQFSASDDGAEFSDEME